MVSWYSVQYSVLRGDDDGSTFLASKGFTYTWCCLRTLYLLEELSDLHLLASPIHQYIGSDSGSLMLIFVSRSLMISNRIQRNLDSTLSTKLSDESRENQHNSSAIEAALIRIIDIA